MRDAFDVFRDRNSSEGDWWRVLDNLGRVSEPPSFWSAIANDSSRRPDQRAIALTALVARHVAPGRTTVEALGSMLGGALWFDDNDLHVVQALGGKIPVPWSPEDTVAVVELPGHRGAIYLAIAGKWRPAQVAAALRGPDRRDAIATSVIKDAAVETQRLSGRTIVRPLV